MFFPYAAHANHTVYPTVLDMTGKEQETMGRARDYILQLLLIKNRPAHSVATGNIGDFFRAYSPAVETLVNQFLGVADAVPETPAGQSDAPALAGGRVEPKRSRKSRNRAAYRVKYVLMKIYADPDSPLKGTKVKSAKLATMATKKLMEYGSPPVTDAMIRVAKMEIRRDLIHFEERKTGWQFPKRGFGLEPTPENADGDREHLEKYIAYLATKAKII